MSRAISVHLTASKSTWAGHGRSGEHGLSPDVVRPLRLANRGGRRRVAERDRPQVVTLWECLPMRMRGGAS